MTKKTKHLACSPQNIMNNCTTWSKKKSTFLNWTWCWSFWRIWHSGNSALVGRKKIEDWRGRCRLLGIALKTIKLLFVFALMPIQRKGSVGVL
ncbi:uncharacterized protein LOC141910898 isoform X2 [Tubulanus polymorphus]|uniref:uncharacterized protein LOC141910898 isoform X2 n=1 Tax=Tubulanus polymorphus TaxID=672921 RepID=UPI003DA375AF